MDSTGKVYTVRKGSRAEDELIAAGGVVKLGEAGFEQAYKETEYTVLQPMTLGRRVSSRRNLAIKSFRKG